MIAGVPPCQVDEVGLEWRRVGLGGIGRGGVGLGGVGWGWGGVGWGGIGCDVLRLMRRDPIRCDRARLDGFGWG